ncbi:hypothetical protein DM02DRAFT_629036 [Periconia macrospinosa]|uniref:Actin-like ATPase domain-containing protein n=1 Tax=Periconia macrospinosa TaxID=97972 RepID=A0A2V1DP24_9PLEO|nr:hypothetical protein DM02DRAFT_629036 [Periconia macrospinosa]
MQEFDPGPILDEIQDHRDEDIDRMDVDDLDEDQRPSQHDRLLISVDFGTTFSCVAYTRVRKGVRPGAINVSQVRCINRFKDYKPRGEMAPIREDVPTELWYSVDSNDEEPLVDESASAQDMPPRKATQWKSTYASSDEDEPEEPREVRSRQRIQEDRSKSSRPSCWGFGVQNQLRRIDIQKQEHGHISSFKLLLDNGKNTKALRHKLQPIVRFLESHGLIHEANDLYTHYLTHLLENAKAQLEEKGELEDDPYIEFILCVPAKWPIKGSRVLQDAMEKAVKDAGFGRKAQDSVTNLFLVSEPEAAAACVLAENLNEIYLTKSIKFDEVVLILDAGGGTVDAVTYGITKEEPLRMDAEVVKPDSEVCGASFINHRFKEVLEERLKDETYLIKNGKTLATIIEGQTIMFENGEKRSFNTEDRYSELDPIYIDDLKEDRQKGLRQNCFILNPNEINYIFKDSLRGTRDLLKRQLQLAEDKAVQKVILTGGFGQSPALQDYLRKQLGEYNKAHSTTIALLIPRSPSTAVAKGAVLRALKKRDGPERVIQCSYGFLRDELYEPHRYTAHRKARAKIDEADGERYIIDTIDWLISAGDRLPSHKEIAIPVRHTFALESERLICIEELYISEKKHKSHYKKGNANNKGAELAGSIIADMTFLRDEGRIQPESPSQFSKFSEEPEKRHWAVHFELVMIVEGRNLQYQARWPMQKDLQAGQQPSVQAQAQVCIAAAFRPGTA